jgi:O-antigen/teichoic acid export membrane protein
MAIDGSLRVLGAAVLAGAAIRSGAAFGWVLVASPLIAVGCSLLGARWPKLDGPAVEAHVPTWAALARSMSWMLVATLAAQILVNGGVVVIKALASPGDAAAGHFLTALALARVPLFLFAALQASLLPGLSRRIAAQDMAGARSALRHLLVQLLAAGTSMTLILLAAGPELNALVFGSDYRVARAPVVVLSIATTVYMLAAAIGQALFALSAPAMVAAGWLAGVTGFAAGLALPGGLSLRVSAAFLIGAAASLAWLAVALNARLDAAHATGSIPQAVP